MVINIASNGGRTHMLDLARELDKHGHTIRFYSYVPTKRAIKYGLKKECSYSIFYWVLPFLFIFKLFGFGKWRTNIYNRFCDIFIALYMKPCDIFIGQSPMHNYSIRYVKNKYKAITILERGSIHVNEYERIYKDIKKKEGQSNRAKKWDADGYKYPDYISVGSNYVKNTFISNGISEDKIFVNNYGFNKSIFHKTILKNQPYDLIFVGRWSLLKGCQSIIELCGKRSDLSFLHVGSITDLEFPTNLPNMHHIDTVDEQELINYYSKAKIFILPTYIEGFALVQMQAAACGLPLVCSKESGVMDMLKYTNDEKWIQIIENHSIDEIEKSVNKALELANLQKGERYYLNNHFTESSWEGYGNRYNQFLNNITTLL